jgi:hypothetical protein
MLETLTMIAVTMTLAIKAYSIAVTARRLLWCKLPESGKSRPEKRFPPKHVSLKIL